MTTDRWHRRHAPGHARDSDRSRRPTRRRSFVTDRHRADMRAISASAAAGGVQTGQRREGGRERKREGGRERERGGGREGGREGEREREREREREGGRQTETGYRE